MAGAYSLTKFLWRGDGRLSFYMPSRVVFSLLFVVLALVPQEVWAQGATTIGAAGAYTASAGGNSFGDFICRMRSQTSSLPNFLAWCTYAAGVFFVARMLMLLKDHVENPQQVKLHKPLLYGLAGSMLLALPGASTALINSVYGAQVGGATACVATTAVVAGVGLDVLAQNFVANIQNPIFHLGSWVCYFMGIFFLWRGIDKMARYGTDPRVYSMTMIMSNLLFGSILMWIARAKEMIMHTLWAPAIVGAAADNPLIYASTATGTGLINWVALGVVGPTVAFDNAYVAATTFMQIIGFIAFLRGWFLCKRAVEGVGNATIGQGLTHIIGGALCMNLILFLRAAQATFNVNFLT